MNFDLGTKIARPNFSITHTLSGFRFGYKWSFLLMTLFLAFSFRAALIDIPNQIRGESFIAFDELIPIFDMQSQYLDQFTQGYSPLTNTNEIRIRYSAMSTWTRYYPIITLSLIIVNAISFLIFVYTSKRIIDLFFTYARISRSSKLLLATVVNFPIFIILLYNKVTHYYTLILGAALFALAIELTLELLFAKKFRDGGLLVLFLLVLLNPAVHYHLLFYVFAAFVIALAIIINIVFRQQRLKDSLISLTKLIVICVLSAVLYSMFLFSNNSAYTADNLNSLAAVNVSLIDNSSTTLDHVLSLDMYSPLDNYLYQQYLPAQARVANMGILLISILALFMLLVPAIRKRLGIIDTKLAKVIVLVLFLALAMSIYFAVGLTFEGSVYSLLVNNIASPFFNTPIGKLVLTIGQTFVQVIRFPHRFQFIYLVALSLLASITAACVYIIAGKVITRFYSRRQFIRLSIIIAAVGYMTLPFMGTNLFSTMIGSGNWNGAFDPIELSQYRQIRDIIPKDGKVFYAPYLEFNKFVNDGDDIPHRFIDKFWLYLFNHDSSYYGLGGDVKNKLNAFLFYRAALFEDSWWLKVLRDQDFKYLVMIKNATSETFDSDNSVEASIVSNSSLRKLYESDNFILYTFEEPAEAEQLNIMLDWPNYIKLMNENSPLNRQKFEYPFNKIGSQLSGQQILTDDSNNLKYMVEAFEVPKSVSHVSGTELTFRKDVYSASYYQASVLSMLSILDNDIANNKIGIPFPSVMMKSLHQYAGSTKPFATEITIQANNRCSLIFSGSYTDNKVKFTLRKNGNTLAEAEHELKSATDKNDIQFTKLELPELESGKYTLLFDKLDSSPLLVNYVLCSNPEYQNNLKLTKQDNYTLSNGKILSIFKKE
jgi:hypothetical protein